ncbi:MAG: YbaB/EbfC family nucleoid-associated protein [Acidobacteriota bacterium]
MKMKDIQKMMKQAQAMQSQIEADMDGMEMEGSAGGGMVRVVLDGKKNLKSVSIKPDAVDPEDVEMLEDLIQAAFQDASRQVDESVGAKFGDMSGGLMGGM